MRLSDDNNTLLRMKEHSDKRRQRQLVEEI